MTYHYQVHTYIAQWREQAKNDPVERAYIEHMGLAPFINMSGVDPNSAPRMRLIEEFINGTVHHPDRMEAEVDGKTCVIDVALITRFLHLPIGDTAEILANSSWTGGALSSTKGWNRSNQAVTASPKDIRTTSCVSGFSSKPLCLNANRLTSVRM